MFLSFKPLRCRSILIGLLLCGLAMCSGASAQVVISAGSASGSSGAQIDVPITVRQFNNILSAQGSVSFDPAVATFHSTSGYTLPGFTSSNIGTSQVSNGLLAFAWNDPALVGIDVPDDTIIFLIRFELVGANGTQSTIGFQNTPTPIEFVDSAFASLPFVANPGTVVVQPPSAQVDVSAGLAIGVPGEFVDIPISVAQFNNIVAAQGSLFWNVGVATYDSTHEFGLPNFSTQNIGTSQIANGRLAFSWSDPKLAGVSVPDNTTILTIRFHLIGAAGTETPIEFQNAPTPIEFTDSTFSVVPFTVNPGGITIVAPLDAVFLDGFE